MKNKKTVITVTSIVAVLLVIIGVTYAYWLVTKTQTNQNIISSGCLDISLSGEKNDIELQDQFPLSDVDGMKLTPYEFTVTNNCTTGVDYHINLESIGTESTAIKASAIKAVINENTPKKLYEYVGTEPTINGAYESYTLLYGTLAGSSTTTTEDTATYELRLWIDADAPISEMNKTYTGKISVSVGQNITSQGSTLASLILSDAEENNYLYSTTPDFSKVTADGEYGLYSAQDDYGTSYYFRGDVETNYVKLGPSSKFYYPNTTSIEDILGDYNYYKYNTYEACMTSGTYWTDCLEGEESLYWRIIRINGDGTIRMIYDGTFPLENGTAHTATVGSSFYNNLNYDYSDLKRVGYTYDDGTGTQVDSTIKSTIDDWYNDNLKEDYEKYIADGIFCNDREVSSTSEMYINFAFSKRFQTKAPKLTCTNISDRYTTSKSLGNGLLTNPVGLITADEVMFAGGTGTSNTSFYLNSNDEGFWTLTPNYFLNAPDVVGIYAYGTAYRDEGDLFESVLAHGSGVRPVINLKSDVLFEGSGTINEPYKLAVEN